jgi:hypothetical protein
MIAFAPAVIDIVNQPIAWCAGMIPPIAPDPPVIPRHIDVAVTPRSAPAVIIIIPVIRLVIVAGAIDHRAVVFVLALVTGRVAHFHRVFRHVIDADKGGVIHR